MNRIRVFRHWYRITGSFRLAYLAGFARWAENVTRATDTILQHRRTCKLPSYECPECVRLSK